MSTDAVSVHERLLNAAIDASSVFGLARLSMGDVAQRAGVSRQTLYRHFADKDDLVRAALTREAAVIVTRVQRASAQESDPLGSLERALAEALNALREHPLLDRLVTTEPESMLPLLTGPGIVHQLVHDVVLGILAAYMGDDADQPNPMMVHAADLVTRLVLSYAVFPPEQSPEAIARTSSRILIFGLSDIMTPASTRSFP